MARKFIIFNKLLLLFSIIIFSFHSFTKADDIGEFEIEGMSIGDSLLNYFSEEEIIYGKNNNSFMYSSKEFQIIWKPKKQSDRIYDKVQIVIKPKDKKYITYAIEGILDFDNKINECYKKQKKIVSEIESLVGNKAKKIDQDIFKHNYDDTGKSTVKAILLEFDNKDFISVNCTDWNEKYKNEKGWTDNLKVSIVKDEYRVFANSTKK